MRKFATALVLCIVAWSSMVAGENGRRRVWTTAKVSHIETGLINAFQSGVPGLQASAAVTLMEVRKEVPTYRWSRCIIPLMRIVNDEDGDSHARMAAALALYGLRSDRGDYLIVQNARFTSDPRVRRFCTLLVNSHLLEEESTP